MKCSDAAGSGVVLMSRSRLPIRAHRRARGEASCPMKRPVNAGEAAVLAEDGERLVQPEADALARHRHPQRVDDVSQLDAPGLDEVSDELLQAGGVERLGAGQRLAAVAQQVARALRLA